MSSPDIVTSKKKTAKVVFYTEQRRIEGTAHLLASEHYTFDNRLVDLMNSGKERFVVVTDAKTFNLQGELLYTAEYVILNKDFITLVYEKEAIRSPTSLNKSHLLHPGRVDVG